MTRRYGRFAGGFASLALALGGLAMLAQGDPAFADEDDPVYWCEECSTLTDPAEQAACNADCYIVCSHSVCTKTCGPGVFPQCGTGTCDKRAKCVSASCACKLTYYYTACECMP